MDITSLRNKIGKYRKKGNCFMENMSLSQRITGTVKKKLIPSIFQVHRFREI